MVLTINEAIGRRGGSKMAIVMSMRSPDRGKKIEAAKEERSENTVPARQRIMTTGDDEVNEKRSQELAGVVTTVIE